MIVPLRFRAFPLLLAVACLAAQDTTARAGYIFTVDTSGLPASSSSTGDPYTYALEFLFALGGPNTGNTATISGISYGNGGSADATSIQTLGDVAVDPASQATVLSGATSGFGLFQENFTPGDTLQFDVNVTNLPQAYGGADTFTFGILYSDPLNIATTNPNGYDSFVEIDAGLVDPTTNASVAPVLTLSSSDDPNPDFNVPTPTFLPDVSSVPEPASVVLVAGAVLAAGLARCRRSRARRVR
jgi:hypothetical protein